MIKIGDSIAKTLIRKDISVQTQLFRFMSFCGCLSMAFGAVYAILQGDGIPECCRHDRRGGIHGSTIMQWGIF